eukprot:GHVN01038974.1.p1 GENE.GHVN01038974.1~~GHVN01038974.1.p1  ORF type:complete len:266 (+),score=35.68 GHVN01038974.1:108-905(+)
MSSSSLYDKLDEAGDAIADDMIEAEAKKEIPNAMTTATFRQSEVKLFTRNTGTRDKIQADLVAFARSKFNTFDTHTLIKDYKQHGHVARYSDLDGTRCTITKFTAEGMTMKMVKSHFDNLEEVVTKLGAERLYITKLGTDDGREIKHLNIITPAILSNRSAIACFYEIEDPVDKSYTYLASCKGNESIVDEYKSKFGKDVIAEPKINYSKYTPYDGGVNIEMLICVDVKGSIPNFIKKLMCYKHAQAPKMLYEYLVLGKIPVSGL